MRNLFSWLYSRRLTYLIVAFLFFLGLLLLLRLVFVLFFSNAFNQRQPLNTALIEALWLGARFDLRIAIILSCPILLLLLPKINVLKVRFLRAFGLVYMGAVSGSLLVLYAFDFGHYQYLGIRLNATVFRFLEDARLSGEMLWQSYPIVRILLGVLVCMGLLIYGFFKLSRLALSRKPIKHSFYSRVLIAFLLPALSFYGIIGRVSDVNIENPVPIRWSDAYASGNPELAALAINPVVFLYETSRARHDTYDLAQVKTHYLSVAHYLGVSQANQDALRFDRIQNPRSPIATAKVTPPNVVFIMLESLGASRVGAYGNPLTPTPVLDDLLANGWMLERFYVPVTGTAKTVWASITGIPDVTRGKSATRNPLLSRQHLALNALSDYQKIYAIGGSAGWANMNALIRHSIHGVKLFEEGDWKSPNVDVWGISDLNLFKEVDPLLRQAARNGPFFAYIQTAGNHEPFTIPKDSDSFQPLDVDSEKLRLAGFRNDRQFNAVRLLDYSIGRFMEMAKQGGYFDNTIFVMFGDHNNRITTLPFLPPAYELLNLESLHVPGLIYAPKLLKPKVFTEATSLVDLIPTVLDLISKPYKNTTLGRSILNPSPEGERVVTTLFREGNFPLIGAITKDFLLQMNADGSDAKLHDLRSNNPLSDVSKENPKEFDRLSTLARGLHETSRYMLFSNRVSESKSTTTLQ